jgi:hypothetical protein
VSGRTNKARTGRRVLGTDITGRPVFTTLGYWSDAFALAEAHVNAHGAIALMWNGVPTPVFVVRLPPGYTAEDLEADVVAAREPMNAMLRAAGVRPPIVAAGDES